MTLLTRIVGGIFAVTQSLLKKAKLGQECLRRNVIGWENQSGQHMLISTDRAPIIPIWRIRSCSRLVSIICVCFIDSSLLRRFWKIYNLCSVNRLFACDSLQLIWKYLVIFVKHVFGLSTWRSDVCLRLFLGTSVLNKHFHVW